MVETKRKSIGKRIALAVAAIAIGFVLLIIWGLFFPTGLVYDLLCRGASIGVTIYLAYKWSGKTIALVVAVACIAWGIWVTIPRGFS